MKQNFRGCGIDSDFSKQDRLENITRCQKEMRKYSNCLVQSLDGLFRFSWTLSRISPTLAWEAAAGEPWQRQILGLITYGMLLFFAQYRFGNIPGAPIPFHPLTLGKPDMLKDALRHVQALLR
jgi:hypothetical protein